MRGYRPDLSPAKEEYEKALELIRHAKRPLILAGHGILVSGSEHEVKAFAERTCIPVALTLLGLGTLPASHFLNLGMMGMHGEAWVNKTIQEADLLLAFGMRFDDRVTGTLKTYAPNAKRFTSISIPPRSTRTSKWTSRSWETCGKSCWSCCPQRRTGEPHGLDRAHSQPEGRFRRPRHSESPRQRPSLRRARDQRSVARNARTGHDHRHRRRPAPDVGGAILQARALAFADYLRRPGDHGFRFAGGHWREGGAAGCGCVGDRAATAASR